MLRAEELLRTGRGDEALRLLDGALAEANHDVAMLCARAMIRANQAQTLGARADVDLALEFDPNCALAYRIRGMLRVPLGDYPGALQDVELAIRLDPSDRTARRNHASLLSAMNRLDEALKEFDSLLKSDPDDGASLVGRATTWEFKGEWKKCLRDVEKAIRLEPEPGSSKSHYLRARALRQLGRLPEALKALAKVLEIDPDDGLVFVERTLIWLSLGKPKLALSDAEAGVKHQPKDGAAWAHLGHARAMGGDHPGAIMAYEQGLELDPKMAPAWANLGAIRFQSEDYPGAIKAPTRAIEIKHDPSALLNRGRAYAYAKDIKNALADFEHALRHAEPGSAEAREGERLAAMARAQLAR
ncbi:MAG: tetratricopeptide repeat protein [Planctomycetes bacterium]|nr:tetratricopeptide repeat protein [Planctomycetota bacterium]